MPGKAGQVLAAFRVPDTHRAVGRGGDPLPVGVEDRREHLGGVPVHHAQSVPRGRIPQPHGAINPRREQEPAVGAVAQGIEITRMAVQPVDHLSGVGVDHHRLWLVPGRGQEAPVRGKGHEADRAQRQGQAAGLPPRGQVEETHPVARAQAMRPPPGSIAIVKGRP